MHDEWPDCNLRRGGESPLLRQKCESLKIRFIANNEFYSQIKSGRLNFQDVNLIISFLFPNIIRKEILSTGVTAINFHPGILPEYRGCATSCFYLMESENNEYGVTAHFINEKIDDGEVIKIKRFKFDRRKSTGFKLNYIAIQHMLELLKELLERKDILQLEEKYKGTNSFDREEPRGRYFSKRDLDREKRITCQEDPDYIDKKVTAFWFPPYHGANITIGNKTFTLVNQQILEEIGDLYRKAYNTDYMKE